MERLTHERSNGIRTGYWSPNRKDELVERLAVYENTGLTPEEMRRGEKTPGWISADEPPQNECYVLLSFENFSLPLVGRYETDGNGGGAYYIGDEDETCISQDMYVNGWMQLPESYNAHN